MSLPPFLLSNPNHYFQNVRGREEPTFYFAAQDFYNLMLREVLFRFFFFNIKLETLCF